MYKYIGMDIGKNVKEVCIENQNQKHRMRIENTKQSVEQLLNHLDEETVIAMEASGIYWMPIYNYLEKNSDCELKLFNPAQVKAFSKTSIRPAKDDRKDAQTIMEIAKVKNAPNLHIDKSRLELRELLRYRLELTDQRTKHKNRTRRNMHLLFPGYDQVFKTMFQPTSRAIMRTCPTPEQVLKISQSKLTKLIEQVSIGHLGKEKALELIEAANNTIGCDLMKNSLLLELQLSLDQIEISDRQIEQVENEARKLWNKMRPNTYISTIPGIRDVIAMTLYAEIGEMKNYSTPDKLTALAGLDLFTYQSGESKTSSGRMTKRGSPTLRRTLIIATNNVKRHCPEIKNYYEKKRNEGKSHSAAIHATAKKLLRIIHHLDTHQEPYTSKQTA